MKAGTLKRSAPKKSLPQAALYSSNGAPAPQHLVRGVEAGLKFGELETLRRELGLSLDQVAAKLGIARATVHRRKAAGRLALDESDRVVRFTRLFRQAESVFGGKEEARLWLSFPQWGLGGEVPLDYARTEVGARVVENLLGAIEYGVYT